MLFAISVGAVIGVLLQQFIVAPHLPSPSESETE
jgi:hypothetical protein